jgi:hypothetical protein
MSQVIMTASAAFAIGLVLATSAAGTSDGTDQARRLNALK